MNGWKLDVAAKTAHEFLARALTAGTADYAHLLPRIREAMVRIE